MMKLLVAVMVECALALSSSKISNSELSRRAMIQSSVATSFALLRAPTVSRGVTGPTDGNLVDLPPEAVRSYLQYRIPLQTASDFYLFELKDKLADVNQWGEVGELFVQSNNRGQGNPNRIEREFTNVFRILGLSMPPDTADEMRDAQFRFEKAMAKISKATGGIRRDLPVEIDKNAVPTALEGWEEGRLALNSFLASLNETTGLPEMKQIPSSGPSQIKDYGRSERRYIELKKKVRHHPLAYETTVTRSLTIPLLSDQTMHESWRPRTLDSMGSADDIWLHAGLLWNSRPG